VDRVHFDFGDYRTRLSLNNASGIGRSSPTSSSGLNLLSSQANGNSSNNFQFDFPKFGSLPTTAFIETTNPISPPASSGFNSPSNTAPGVLARSGSAAGNVSPRTQARLNGSISSTNGLSASSSGNQTTSANNLDSLFSDSALNGLSGSPSIDYNAFLPNTTTSPPNMNGTSEAGSISNASGQSRIFQFNSTSVSSDSPGSSSSISQYGGPNSSCGTSPEPSHNSPSTGNKDATLDTINEASTETGATSTIPSTTAGSSFSADPVQNFDWFATQNGGTFDPVLFGDYREPQNAIVGDGDFTGGFFNDAMPASFDFSSPFNWADLTAPTGLTPSIQKSNPLEQADALSSGLENITEEVVPGENTDKLLTCNKIW
jgi:AP-1-like factor